MNEEERTDLPDAGASEGEAPEASVFGNLPKERPGVRSPRRDAAGAGRVRHSGDASRARATGAAREASPPRRATQAPPADAPQASPESEGEPGAGGLEDIAWAGVTVAAEAATLGVRLAGRALGAMRGAVERR